VHPSGGVSHLRASTERRLQSLDSDGEPNGGGTPRSSLSNFHTDGDGCHSAHSRRGSRGLLNWSGENSKGSGKRFGKSHNEIDRDDELFPKSLTKTARRKRSNLSLGKKRHNPSRTTLGLPSPMPTRASQQGMSSQPLLLHRPPMDHWPLSCSPRALSPGTKTGNETNNDDKSSPGMSYQVTNFTFCAIPNDSLIVTAIVRHCNLYWSFNLVALGHKFLGKQGKVIRLTQLSPGSWMLLGYRCKEGALDLRNHRGLNAEWISSSHNDPTSHGTDHSDDNWDKEDKNGEEVTNNTANERTSCG
jgi:hypothetical protein